MEGARGFEVMLGANPINAAMLPDAREMTKDVKVHESGQDADPAIPPLTCDSM